MNTQFYELVQALAKANAGPAKRLIRPNEAAAMLGVSKKQLYLMSKEEDFPAKIKIGSRAIAWRLSDLDNWIESRAFRKEGGRI